MPKKSKTLATQGDDADHTYSSVGYPNDAYYLPEGTDLKVMDLKLVDEDGDGDIGPGDTINGSEVTASYLGDAVGVDFGDGEQIVEGVTFYLSDGSQVFMATDGTQLEDGEATGSKWVHSSTDVPVSSITAPCFVAGTLIATPAGEVPVETLRAGDLVLTRDHGAQRLLWVGQVTLPGEGEAAPIRFDPEALGGERPLWVSPQHRMLLQDGRLDLLLAEDEVLAAACHLVNGDSVVPDPRMQVTYVHLLFAQHEIVFAEGVPSESFHPGEEGMRSFGPGRRESAAETFPDLAAFLTGYGPCARRVLRAHEAVVAGRVVIGRRTTAAALAA